MLEAQRGPKYFLVGSGVWKEGGSRGSAAGFRRFAPGFLLGPRSRYTLLIGQLCTVVVLENTVLEPSKIHPTLQLKVRSQSVSVGAGQLGSGPERDA